jgi:hypothetical protein
MRPAFIVATAICFSLPSSAHADESTLNELMARAAHTDELTVNEFLTRYDEARTAAEKLIWTQHIDAIESSFGWANTMLSERKENRLYCVPPKLILTSEQLIDIVRRFLQEQQSGGFNNQDAPMGLFLLLALQEAFPCTQ